MDFGFEGFETSDFDFDVEDVKVVKLRKFDRMYGVGEGGSIQATPIIMNGIVYFGSWDCHLYSVDAEIGKEVWRFATNNIQESFIPPSNATFKAELRRETRIEDSISEEKYKSKNGQSVSLSDYHVTSEYATTSEYKQKSDYDTSFAIFESVLDSENSVLSRPELLIHFSSTDQK